MKQLDEMFPSFTAKHFERRMAILADVPHFPCPSGCSHCCTVDNVSVSVNLFDILLLAAAIGMHPREFFMRHVYLNIEDCRDQDGELIPTLWKIDWCLNRPCPLLGSDDKCRVYEHRPLACRVFPEVNHLYLEQYGHDPTHAQEEVFSDPAFHCFRPPLSTAYIGSKRESALKLPAMIVIESRISDLMTFNRAPFVIDIQPDLEEIIALTAQEKNPRHSPRYSEHNRRIQKTFGASAIGISKDAILTTIKKREARLRGSIADCLDFCTSPDRTDHLMELLIELARRVHALKGDVFHGHTLLLNSKGEIMMIPTEQRL